MKQKLNRNREKQRAVWIKFGDYLSEIHGGCGDVAGCGNFTVPLT